MVLGERRICTAKKSMGVQRSTFLIGPDQKVIQVWKKVSVDGHADAVLEAIAAAQGCDAHLSLQLLNRMVLSWRAKPFATKVFRFELVAADHSLSPFGMLAVRGGQSLSLSCDFGQDLADASRVSG